MITATRRLQFAIGHRVHRHESKCRHLHGHNFVFFLTAERTDLGTDDLGRVIDFGVLKKKVGTWLEMHWDHGMVLWEGDDEAVAAVRYVPGQKVFLLPKNPTAENMAAYVLHVVGPDTLKGTGVRLVKVVIHETENGIATATL
jgi:6-pyruvoyltetrahydropterin/6-carboxytetrahydropterin synthase